MGEPASNRRAAYAPPTPVAGRVYLEPEPEAGPHPGFRGPIRVDALGVHIDEDCESLYVKAEPVWWPDSEWEPVERPQLIPWHRVCAIEWEVSDTHV